MKPSEYEDFICCEAALEHEKTVTKRRRPRKSRDRRLLEAIIMNEGAFEEVVFNLDDKVCNELYKIRNQLIAIKEAMQLKGGGNEQSI